MTPASRDLHRDLEFVFHRHIAEGTPVQLGCAGIFVALAVAIGVAFLWMVAPYERGEPSWLLAFGVPTLLCLAVALFFGWGAHRDSSFARSQAYAAIVGRREDAVWLYVRTAHVTTRHLTHVTRRVVKTTRHLEGAAFIGYRDGSSIEIPLDPALAPLALAALEAALPHCSVGETVELQQAFLADPASLRRR